MMMWSGIFIQLFEPKWRTPAFGQQCRRNLQLQIWSPGYLANTRNRVRLLAAFAVLIYFGNSVPATAGYQEGLGALSRGDYPTAFQEIRPAAESGNADAQWVLAVMYERGQGVPPNHVLSYMWASLALAQLPKDARKREVAEGTIYVLSKKMTPQQIARAQQLAAAWRPRQISGRTGPQANKRAGSDDLQRRSTGSGFAISGRGHIVTNAHVVYGCLQVRAKKGWLIQKTAVLAQDFKNDLALLLLQETGFGRPFVRDPLRLRAGEKVRQGDSVVVIGFPLAGLLASTPNLTTGTVSALAGIGNDRRFLQITAPVQPGNSGGPVLDMAGRVVGIVTSKLDDGKVAQLTGQLPQNVNFALKSGIIARFLEAEAIQFKRQGRGKLRSAADVGKIGSRATFLIECWR